MVVSLRGVVVALTAARLAVASEGTPAVEDFDWDTITPSAHLNYSACYDDFKCAKLELPMDWLNPAANPNGVSLAIIALPATVAEDDESFGGTIITNPGGPGGSGVNWLLRAGKDLRRTASSGGNKKYEVLSFDPRGMGESLPRADCWGDEFERGGFLREELAMGVPGSDREQVGRFLARAKGFGMMCLEKGRGKDGKKASGDIRAFMSSSSVARDMVEIVDKLAEMRGEGIEVKQRVGGEKEEEEEDERHLEVKEDSYEKKLTIQARSEKDVPRIQYWGVSYGTLLGNYFASMFPERIGRVLLEAVADIEDYHDGTWSRNLNDMHYVYNGFFESCFAARENCALWKPSDASFNETRQRFQDWLDALWDNPGVYVDLSDGSSTIHSITPYDVSQAMLGPMYKPQSSFPALAEKLAEAMNNGNYSGVFHATDRPGYERVCDGDEGRGKDGKKKARYTWVFDAQTAVACGDAVDQTGLTSKDFTEYLDHLKTQSPEFGPLWSHVRRSCFGWPYRPAYSFAGPWTSPPPSEDPLHPVPGKPAAGILFVSSRYDPVTPLENAFRMSKQHPGSGVLIQENPGHGTIPVPGKCRDKVISKYFETGEVPRDEDGKSCEADCKPFEKCEGGWTLNTLQNNGDDWGWGAHRQPLHVL